MPRNLTDIVTELEMIPDVNLHPAFDDLRKICSQHPNLRYVQWYQCRVCGINRKVCASPFLPDECICGKDIEAVWVEENVP